MAEGGGERKKGGEKRRERLEGTEKRERGGKGRNIVPKCRLILTTNHANSIICILQSMVSFVPVTR